MSRFKKTLFFIILIIILSISGIFFGLIGALIVILVSLLICILHIIINADKFILLLYKARSTQAGELVEIRNKILMLSKRYGVPEPSMYVTDLELPGSFIIGRETQKTSIIIPKRLSTLLNSEEIEAVIAHNIVQIDNTIRKRTFVALFASAITMYSSELRWGAVFAGCGDYNDPVPKLFGLFLSGLAEPPAAALIQSLPNEDYDAKVVSLLGHPASIICAISHLESNNVTSYSSIGFLCLIDPQEETFFDPLFNVHPPIEVRINNLTAKGDKK